MIGSQAVHGTLLAALAAWQLRPAFRRNQGGTALRTRSRASRRAWRWLAIRPCGDDPVYWKEAYFAPIVAGSGRAVVYAAWIVVLVVSVAGTLYASRDAFGELVKQGYGFGSLSDYNERMALNMSLRIGGSLLIGFWLLQLAGLAAVGIAREREQDTWLGLLATPLEGREILRGKMLGPLRATAPWGITIAALWLIGLAAGAVHPLGLIHAAVVLALVLWFVIALGIYLSLKSKVAWRARAWAQGILIVPHLCCYLPSPLVLAGVSLWSYNEINALWRMDSFDAPGFSLGLAYVLGGIALYGGTAYFLTRAAFRNFDAIADRPRRSGRGVVDLIARVANGSGSPADGDGPV
jgi:hypothetical protein